MGDQFQGQVRFGVQIGDEPERRSCNHWKSKGKKCALFQTIPFSAGLYPEITSFTC